MSTEPGAAHSVTLAYKLKSEGTEIAGIHFDIGYKPRVAERNSARLAAHRLGIALEIVSLPGIFDMVTGFYPTEYVGSGELDKGQVQPIKFQNETGRYIVGFHVLLSVAVYYAQLAGIRKISTALIKEQYDFNPGLNNFESRFIASIQPLNPSVPVAIENPFKSLKKSEIAQIGHNLSVPFQDTWSCHDGKAIHCGICNGCMSRKLAFVDSRLRDPTKYEV